MINNTKIKVAMKYQPMIQLVEKDDDGYWAYSQPGFYFPMMGCHTAHEDTQADLLSVIRTVAPCNCDECKRLLSAEAQEEVTEEAAEGTEEVIPAVITEWVEDYKTTLTGWFSERVEAYREEKQAMNKMDVWKYYEEKKRLSQKYGKTVIKLSEYFTGLNEAIEIEAEKEKESLLTLFISRVTEKVGKITAASDLHVGLNGEINGTVQGTEGTAKVKTVLAGGYNIQCLHYRVMVK